MVYYTIQSTSEEGRYYLVNHWEKHRRFWVRPEKASADMLFSAPRFAKMSLAKLLKVMPEYAHDEFELVEVKGESNND